MHQEFCKPTLGFLLHLITTISCILCIIYSLICYLCASCNSFRYLHPPPPIPLNPSLRLVTFPRCVFIFLSYFSDSLYNMYRILIKLCFPSFFPKAQFCQWELRYSTKSDHLKQGFWLIFNCITTYYKYITACLSTNFLFNI